MGSPPVSTTKGGVPLFPRQGKRVRISKLAPAIAVGADEVGVAEIAGRGHAIGLAARP
jgi:hypothetical protein